MDAGNMYRREINTLSRTVHLDGLMCKIFQMSTCDWPSLQLHHDYSQTLHVNNAQAVLLRMPWLNPFQILTCPLLTVIPLHHYTLHNLCSSDSVLNTQTVHLAVLFCMYHITQLGRPSKHGHTSRHVHNHSVRLLYQTTFQAVPSTDSNNNEHHQTFIV